MNKVVVGLVALAVVVLAYLAMSESVALRDAQADLAAVTRERDALRERVAALENTERELLARNAQLRASTLEDPSAASPAEPAPAATVTRQFASAAASPVDPLDSPAMRSLMAITQKGRLDARYAGLFRMLQLSPERLDRLKQLLVDRQNAPMDVFAAASRQNLLGPNAGAELQQLVQAELAAIDESIHELLGPAGFAEYQAYERTQVERSLVDRLNDRLSYTDAPLTEQQAEALVDLLAAARSTGAASAGNSSPDNVGGARVGIAVGGANMVFSYGPGMLNGGGATITEDTINGARSVLNEQQLAALRELQTEQRAMEQMAELLRRSAPPPDDQRSGWVPVSGEAAVAVPMQP